MFSTEEPEKEAAAVTISTTSASSSYSTEKATAISTEQPEQTSKDTSQGSETLASTASSLFSTEKPTMLPSEVEESAVTVQTEKSSVSPITEKTDMSPGLTATEEVGSGDATPDMFSQTTPVTPTSSQASTGELSTVLSKTVVDVSDQTVMSSTSVVSDVTKTSSITSPPRLGSPEPSTDSGYEILDYGVSKEPVLVESSPSFSGPSTEPDKAAVSTSTDKEDSGDLASTLFTDESLIVSTTMFSMFSTEKPVTTASDETTDSLKSTATAPSSLYSTEKPAFTIETQESVSKDQTSIAAEAISTLATTEEGSGGLIFDVSTKQPVSVSASSTSMFSTEKPSVTTESHVIDSSRTTPSPASSLYSTERPTSISSESQHSFTTSKSETYSVTPEASSVLLSTLEEGSGNQSSDISTQETVTVTSSSVFSTEAPEKEAAAVTISTTSASSSYSTEKATAISTEKPEQTSKDTSQGSETLASTASSLFSTEKPTMLPSEVEESAVTVQTEKSSVSPITEKMDMSPVLTAIEEVGSGDATPDMFSQTSPVTPTSSQASTGELSTVLSKTVVDVSEQIAMSSTSVVSDVTKTSPITSPPHLGSPTQSTDSGYEILDYGVSKEPVLVESSPSFSGPSTELDRAAVSTSTDKDNSGDLAATLFTDESLIVSTITSSMFSTKKPLTTASDETTDSLTSTVTAPSSLYSTEKPAFTIETQESVSKDQTSIAAEAISTLTTTEEGSGGLMFDVSTNEPVSVSASSTSMFSTEKPSVTPESHVTDSSRTTPSPASSLYSTERPTSISSESQHSFTTSKSETYSVTPEASSVLLSTLEEGSGDRSSDVSTQETVTVTSSSMFSTEEPEKEAAAVTISTTSASSSYSTEKATAISTEKPEQTSKDTSQGSETLASTASSLFSTEKPTMLPSEVEESAVTVQTEKSSVSPITEKMDMSPVLTAIEEVGSGDATPDMFSQTSPVTPTSSQASTGELSTVLSKTVVDVSEQIAMSSTYVVSDVTKTSPITNPPHLGSPTQSTDSGYEILDYGVSKEPVLVESSPSFSGPSTEPDKAAVSTSTDKEDSGDLASTLFTDESLIVSTITSSMFSTKKPLTTASDETTDSLTSTVTAPSSLYSTEKPAFTIETQESVSKDQTSIAAEAISTLATTEEGSGGLIFDVSTKQPVSVSASSTSMFSTEKPSVTTESHVIDSSRTTPSPASSLYSTERPTSISSESQHSFTTSKSETYSVTPEASSVLLSTLEEGSGNQSSDISTQETVTVTSSSMFSTEEPEKEAAAVTISTTSASSSYSTEKATAISTEKPEQTSKDTSQGSETLASTASSLFSTEKPTMLPSEVEESAVTVQTEKSSVSPITEKMDMSPVLTAIEEVGSGDATPDMFSQTSPVTPTSSQASTGELSTVLSKTVVDVSEQIAMSSTSVVSDVTKTKKPVTTASDETTDSLKSTATAPSSLYSTEKPAFTIETQESVSKDQTSIAAEAISTLTTTEEGSGGLMFDVSTKEPVSVSASSTSMFSTEKPSVTPESHVTDSSKTTPSPASSLYSTERPTSISSESQHSFTTSTSETYSVTPEASSVLLSTVEEGSGDRSSDVSTQETVTVTSSSMFSTEEPEKEAAAVTISTTSASSSYSTEKATAISTEQPEQTSKDTSQGSETVASTASSLFSTEKPTMLPSEVEESAVTVQTEKSSVSPITEKTDMSPGLTATEEVGSGDATPDMFSQTTPVTPTSSQASIGELSTVLSKTLVDVSDQTVMSSTSVVSDVTKTTSITSPPRLGSPEPSTDSGYEILDYGVSKEPVVVEYSPSFSGPSTEPDKAAVSTSTDKEDSGDLASTLFTDESLIVSTTMFSMFSTEKPVTTASDETTDSLKSTATAPSSLYSTEKPAFTIETQESVSKDQTSIAAEAISTLTTTEEGSGGLMFDESTKEPVSVSASSTSMFSTEKPSVTPESHVTDSSRTTPSPASSLYSTERPTSISSESKHSFTTSKSETYSVIPEASSVLLSTLDESSGDQSSDVSTQETVTVTSSSVFSTEAPEKEAAAVTISTTSASSSFPSEKATAILTEQSETSSELTPPEKESSGVQTTGTSEAVASTSSSLFSTEKFPTPVSSLFSTEKPTLMSSEVDISTMDSTIDHISSTFTQTLAPTSSLGATPVTSLKLDHVSVDLSITIATVLPTDMFTVTSVFASTIKSTEESTIETPSEATKQETSMDHTVSPLSPSPTMETSGYPTRETSTFIDMEASVGSGGFVDDDLGSTLDGSGYEFPKETFTKPEAEFTFPTDEIETDDKQSTSAVPSFASSTYLSTQPTMDSESSTQSLHITSTGISTATTSEQGKSTTQDGSTDDHTNIQPSNLTVSTVYSTESITEGLVTDLRIDAGVDYGGEPSLDTSIPSFPETTTSTDETVSITTAQPMSTPSFDTESDGLGDLTIDVSSMFSTGKPKVTMSSHETATGSISTSYVTAASSLFSTEKPTMAPSNMTTSHSVTLGPSLTDTSTPTITLLEEERSGYQTPGVFSSIPSEATGETESFVSVTPGSDELATSKESKIIPATQSILSSETPSYSSMEEINLAEQTTQYSHPTMMPHATPKLVSDHTASDTTTSSSSSEFTSMSTSFPSIVYHSVTDQQVMIISPTSSQANDDLSEQTPTMVLHGTKPSASTTIIFTEEATDEDSMLSTVTDSMKKGSPKPELITKDNTIIDADTFSVAPSSPFNPTIQTEEAGGVTAMRMTPMLDGTEKAEGSGSDRVTSTESTPSTPYSTSESSETSSPHSESTSSLTEVFVLSETEGSSSSSSESSSAEMVTFVPQTTGETYTFTVPHSMFPAATAKTTAQLMDADSTSDSISDKVSGSTTEITYSSSLPSSPALNESAGISTDTPVSSGEYMVSTDTNTQKEASPTSSTGIYKPTSGGSATEEAIISSSLSTQATSSATDDDSGEGSTFETPVPEVTPTRSTILEESRTTIKDGIKSSSTSEVESPVTTISSRFSTEKPAMPKGEETTANAKATASSLFSTETPTVSVSDITGEPTATVKAEQGTLSSISDITTEESSGQSSIAEFTEEYSLYSTIKPQQDMNTEETVSPASHHATEKPTISSGSDVTSKEGLC
ncbi:hypothetical protein N1851_033829 [Merluccius polli]|uniref:Uncharacterized protein n=1 Tax=Merluccius polli TaxID=89951 RepID=A0AA47M0N8_MERPO|nr:hypothetical protein N1851_033829 [Merluccius polli]